ncbi:hypothetical protein GC387_17795 [Pseudomonas sp. MWU12-2323]|nr:hypothetical protein [Pseudomonas sp. MWU12-2323]
MKAAPAATVARPPRSAELIVPITPRVITDNSEARQITDEYRQQLQLMKPLEPPPMQRNDTFPALADPAALHFAKRARSRHVNRTQEVRNDAMEPI